MKSKTVVLSMNLAVSRTRTFDLNRELWGYLDFLPNKVTVKYIAYSSVKNASSLSMPILTCDFLLHGDILAPYLAATSFTPLDVTFDVKFPYNQPRITLTSKSISQEETASSYINGTIFVCLEFYYEPEQSFCG